MATKTSARRTAGGRKSTSRKRTAGAVRSKSAAKRGATKTAGRARTGKPTPERPSKGISRIDQPSRRTHGFFVRLDYRKTPEGYRPRQVAFFGDASHGSKRGAWKAAEAWATKMRRGSARAGGAAKRR
jgi:hypothetical protein